MSAEPEQSGATEEQASEATREEAGKQEDREGREEIRKLEEADEVPTDPRDWPGGKAKYLTFGGGEDQTDEPFGEGLMAKLGPSDVHHQADGSVIVKGEKVDNPEDYKGEPIPGGPTDPDAPKLAGEQDLSGESSGGEDGEKSGRSAEGSAQGSEDEESESGQGESESAG